GEPGEFDVDTHLASHPEDYKVRTYKVVTLLGEYQFEEALKHLRILQKTAPPDVRIDIYMQHAMRVLPVEVAIAVCLEKLGRVDEALAELKGYSELHREDLLTRLEYVELLGESESVGADKELDELDKIIQSEVTGPEDEEAKARASMDKALILSRLGKH